MSVFPGWKISYELPSFPIIHTKFKLHYSQTEKKKKILKYFKSVK